MKEFMAEDFLLDTETARRLFFDYAAKQPIIDWHCHVPPKEIAENRQFKNIAQMWLEGDHYKWRAMRQCGVDEKYITGGASDREKYDAWVKTLSRAVGNPLYHWTHLELSRCFGIRDVLCEKNADRIWEKANALIAQPGCRVRGILSKMNVEAVFTTDDPADGLRFHKAIREDEGFRTAVLPAFRPEKALHIENAEFASYIKALGEAAGGRIGSFEELKQALRGRMDFFEKMGCRASDQSVTDFPWAPASDDRVEKIFRGALGGSVPTDEETEIYQTALLRWLTGEYAENGWVMELHIGAMRNNNTKMFRRVGPDAGFDSVSDGALARKLSRFLDAADVRGLLPKTVLFSLNPKDNAVLGSMCGNFAEKTDGKVQLGTAWWFNDNRDGMEAQIKTYANLGILSNFIGMLTDSRSFLSYPRHEYFRRILCNVIGNWVENGEFPADYGLLGEIVEGICCRNARKYFGLAQ